ncbi:MAG TPA: hypothetical protein VFT22_17130 [Kofleriaceae bacterium]|nr:hypothetical protein [Kofleriaceae bacterium]
MRPPLTVSISGPATAAALLAALAACSPPAAIPGARFVNAPPVAAVDDRLDVPHPPSSRDLLLNVYHWDGILQRRLARALELPPPRRALGVSSIDEVPDSTWFTNRIGVRDLSIDEVTAGPVTLESPELHKPWTIKSTKSGEGDLGFVIADARGEKFLLKFDAPGYPEQETATHVIVGKILWACGFNVSEDFVVQLRPDDLVVGRDATLTDKFGEKHPLDRAEVERRLATVEPTADGRLRALASRWVDGKGLGGHPAEGVREDDRNDRIPHQLRRDLRGAYPIFAWLDHVDIQESNFLDTWVKDRRDPSVHYVKHYLLDFGKSLGVMATTGHDPRRGHSYVIDLAAMTTSLLEAGLARRSWEGRHAPRLRGVGLFEAESYDPGAWVTDYPVYIPFLFADRFDKFWGAKILMRFTRAQLHAIVEAGQLSDPRAVEYITDTLVARQRATGAYWFARVAPLDRFATSADQLCFDDLSIVYGFADARTTRYRATRYDRNAHPLGEAGAHAEAGGRSCVALALAGDGDGYTVVRLETTRPDFTGTTFVHVARDPVSGGPRVIGIWRT